MINVKEMLLTQRDTINAQIKALKVEVTKIDAALQAVEEVSGPKLPNPAKGSKLNVNDAIIEAIKNGHHSATEIVGFIEKQLILSTTLNSVRTRLSALKKEKKISNTAKGWVMLNLKDKPSDKKPEGSKVTGEVTASPNESSNALKTQWD